MLRLVILIFLPSVAADLLFQQNDYELTFERIELEEFDKGFLKDARIVTSKYNRTTPAMNASFTYLQNFDRDMQVVLQAYTFLSNEYRLFPMRFQFDACAAMDNNDFGFGRLLDCGNFTKCPLKKGRYLICNWSPDGSRFPPNIPNGKYMMKLEWYHANIKIFVANMYVNIYRPLTFFKQKH
ncbi:hypothetical protein ILUMI_02964 [Ignelater luminosus]|uniref:Uncharacterized protein n=1 Tax=Ignelater luminosus TaxID=2038154 RepID=A0A8K0GMP0_IGNLU|nr:hypothetical protein ILUMI_02964 [Ignelater luminosus]